MVKIILSDIDGTLLTPESTVTEKTAETVRRAVRAGLPFALVSARMPEAIYPITDKMGLRLPLVCYSGAYVLTDMGDVLFSKTMRQEDARAVLTALQRDYPHLTCNLYAGHHWYVEDLKDPRVIREMDITEAQAEQADLRELLATTLPHKYLLMGEPGDIEAAEKELSAAFPALNVVRSAPHLLEIMDKSIAKDVGIEKLLAHYGLKKEDALAFGDNYNDIEMLRYVGTSVAMGNAPEKIKEIATEVTGPNTEDGLATYLLEHEIVK